MVHHPTIPKEVDDLLDKGSIEPWMGGAGFYLKQFNCFLHTPSFKMPTIRQA